MTDLTLVNWAMVTFSPATTFITTMPSKGSNNHPYRFRITADMGERLLAIVRVLAGALRALQKVTIIAA